MRYKLAVSESRRLCVQVILINRREYFPETRITRVIVERNNVGIGSGTRIYPYGEIV